MSGISIILKSLGKGGKGGFDIRVLVDVPEEELKKKKKKRPRKQLASNNSPNLKNQLKKIEDAVKALPKVAHMGGG